MTQQDIFTAALQITDPDARSAYLTQACGGDAELRRRVEILLRTHASAGDFLARPAVEQLAGAQSPRPGETAEDEALGFLQPAGVPGALGRLGHYEVLEVLGKGGFGIVVKALDERLRRPVAIKVLAPALAATSPPRRRFLREARAAAAVRHDNVVAIYAVEEQPLPYLVMEYVEGETLQQRLDRVGPLDVPALLRIGMQVARGLAAAHAQGVIHRDIKPANILLENGSERVKISDFGLARSADDASASQSGFIGGTPLYMAPEQARGEALDHRADLFSLGSVLYVMVSGRPPFRAPTTLAVLQRVAADTPRPIREIIPEVPEWLCALIARLHAKRPEDRFASAQQVADLLAGSVGQVADRPAPKAGRRPAPRRPWLWAAAAALAMLLAGLGLTEATGVTEVRGTVIRLFSPQGTLVVEADDPGVSVTVDGADVVITGTGVKELRLKPGQHKVEASKDGKVVRQELVTVTRNGRQVVRVSQEAAPPAEVERWEKSVAALPAEQQVEDVVKRLKELNPRFDGRVEPTTRDGVVIGLRFNTDQVSDLSPLRALTGLEDLYCNGTAERHGSVADLSPLRGLPLKTLWLLDNQVTDLSPLRGMPLKTLVFQRNHALKDLTPLEGMPLEHLECAHTNVADLSPLKGMKLKHLSCDETLVSDLSPLRGMALEAFSVAHCRRVTDLSPLKGMPLHRLLWIGTGVSDTSPLQGMPLKEVVCDFQRERDAEFLRSFKTVETINGKSAAEFWKEVDGK
jgi:hypothetical protein